MKLDVEILGQIDELDAVPGESVVPTGCVAISDTAGTRGETPIGDECPIANDSEINVDPR
jgi:hypothetical protein